jgi:hypothetical protein
MVDGRGGGCQGGGAPSTETPASAGWSNCCRCEMCTSGHHTRTLRQEIPRELWMMYRGSLPPAKVPRNFYRRVLGFWSRVKVSQCQQFDQSRSTQAEGDV